MLPSFLEKEFPSRRGVSAYMELYERVPSPEKESTCFGRRDRRERHTSYWAGLVEPRYVARCTLGRVGMLGNG